MAPSPALKMACAAGHFQEIAPSPGKVADVARFVAAKRVVAGKVFGTGGYAVGQKMVAFDFSFYVTGNFEIFRFAGVGEEH